MASKKLFKFTLLAASYHTATFSCHKPWEKVMSEDDPRFPLLQFNPSFKMEPVPYTEEQQVPAPQVVAPEETESTAEGNDFNEDLYDPIKLVTHLGEVPELPKLQLPAFLGAGYETVASVLTASDEELLAVKGIGEKTIITFKTVLGEFAKK